MKKLMIALAAVAMVAASEAAVTNWKFTTSTNVINDGYKNDGSGYSAKKLTGQTMYLIAVASDTTGVGISQSKLLEAFRGDDFNLASYAVPITSGKNSADTNSSGIVPATTAVNGTEDAGDFHVSESKYGFYLATVVTDGEDSYLYMSDIVESVAGSSTATKTLTFSKTTNSSKVNFADGDYAGAGWYTAVPEPTSGLLLLLGVAGLALRRRRA